MDKFLFLVRGYLNATFQHLARIGWETTTVEKNMAVLSSIPLSLTDKKVPNGLRYHAIDIYVDELDKADTPRSGILPLQVLLNPLNGVAADCPTKSVRTRAKDALADIRLQNWLGEEDRVSRANSFAGEEHSQEVPL